MLQDSIDVLMVRIFLIRLALSPRLKSHLLSSAEYILYTTWYSSLTLGELGVVRLGGLCESKMWERTRDVLLYCIGTWGLYTYLERVTVTAIQRDSAADRHIR